MFPGSYSRAILQSCLDIINNARGTSHCMAQSVGVGGSTRRTVVAGTRMVVSVRVWEHFYASTGLTRALEAMLCFVAPFASIRKRRVPDSAIDPQHASVMDSMSKPHPNAWTISNKLHPRRDSLSLDGDSRSPFSYTSRHQTQMCWPSPPNHRTGASFLSRAKPSFTWNATIPG